MKAVHCLLVVVALALVGCVPAKVRDSVTAGEARARKAVSLLDSGDKDPVKMEQYIRAEAEDWAALKRAVVE